jgi:small subunit ribosomal protein S4e
MKNHLKRIASPRTWLIARKTHKFIVRPSPGGHSMQNSLALGVILRDNLGLASTMTEIKKLLNNQEVLIDGKRKKDHRLPVGLFDIISLPVLKKQYRILLDTKGRLFVQEIPASEASSKICRVVGKTVLGKDKMQFNLHDGKNIIATQKAKVGDSLVLGLSSLEIKEVLPLQEGSFVFLISGKHAGASGVLKAFKGTEATFTSGSEEIETAKSYLYVVGSKKSAITLEVSQQ